MLWLLPLLVVLFIAIYFVQRMFFRFLIRVRADISTEGIERKMKQIEEMLDVDSGHLGVWQLLKPINCWITD